MYPNYRYVLAVRSPDFKSMFAMQAPPVGEPLKIHLDATTGAVGALVKYLYTDAVDNDDITEDLIALASKYNLVQLKVNKVYSTYWELFHKNLLQFNSLQ